MTDTCEECDATAIGGGNDALLLKCESRFVSTWKETCLWQCPFCEYPIDGGVSIACFIHANGMVCVGNAIRSALTPSRVGNAIIAALRKKQPPAIDSQAWERAFGPDYLHRILWFSPACGPFRVAEDGTAADVDDRQLPLPPQPWLVATVRDVGPVEWERWRRVFGDYEIMNPIEQWATPLPPTHRTGTAAGHP